MTARHETAMQAAIFYELYPCAFGMGAVCWRQGKKAVHIVRVLLPAKRGEAERLLRGAYPGAVRAKHPAVTQTITKLKALTEGRAVSFSLSLLALDSCPPFQQRVLSAEAEIPRGRVSTYGRIAAHLCVPLTLYVLAAVLLNFNQ